LNSLTQYNIENNDQQLIDITRKILVQVIGLDKYIFQIFRVIRKLLIELGIDSKNLNNPYYIDPSVLPSPYLKDLGDKDIQSVLITIFKAYLTCLTLQRVLSYALLNADAVYDLKLIFRGENVTKSKSIYDTKDSVDKDVVKESEKLMGIQVIDYELFKEIISYFGNFSNKGSDGFSDIALDDSEDSTREATAIKLIFSNAANYDLFLKNVIDSSFSNTLPNGKFLNIIGLKIVQKIYDMLPNSLSGILNSAILFSLPDTLIKLLGMPNPKVWENVFSVLSNIEDRFKRSVPISDQMADQSFIIRRFMLDFLRNSLGSGTIRVNDLSNLIQNPSINSSLIYFRSLTDMTKKVNDFDKVSWSVPNDASFRLKFDFILYWSLGEKKLSTLAWFSLYRATKKDEWVKYGIRRYPPLTEVRLEEMLPGTMDDDAQNSDGSLLFNPIFDKDQKKIAIIKDKLKRYKGLEEVLIQETRWPF